MSAIKLAAAFDAFMWEPLRCVCVCTDVSVCAWLSLVGDATGGIVCIPACTLALSVQVCPFLSGSCKEKLCCSALMFTITPFS